MGAVMTTAQQTRRSVRRHWSVKRIDVDSRARMASDGQIATDVGLVAAVIEHNQHVALAERSAISVRRGPLPVPSSSLRCHRSQVMQAALQDPCKEAARSGHQGTGSRMRRIDEEQCDSALVIRGRRAPLPLPLRSCVQAWSAKQGLVGVGLPLREGRAMAASVSGERMCASTSASKRLLHLGEAIDSPADCARSQ